MNLTTSIPKLTGSQWKFTSCPKQSIKSYYSQRVGHIIMCTYTILCLESCFIECKCCSISHYKRVSSHLLQLQKVSRIALLVVQDHILWSTEGKLCYCMRWFHLSSHPWQSESECIASFTAKYSSHYMTNRK